MEEKMSEAQRKRVDEAEDEMAVDIEEMEERSDKLASEIEETKEDWEQKKQDGSVPGAQPDAEGDEADPADARG
jgi:hypothetical protein